MKLTCITNRNPDMQKKKAFRISKGLECNNMHGILQLAYMFFQFGFKVGRFILVDNIFLG